jgi:hypothetical protein
MAKIKTASTEVIRVRINKEHALNVRIAAAKEQRPFANMLNKILSDYFAKQGK